MADQINIETLKGDFSEAPLSYEEFCFSEYGVVSPNVIKDWRLKLKRQLTYEELLILKACEKEGIIFSDQFKPFTG